MTGRQSPTSRATSYQASGTRPNTSSSNTYADPHRKINIIFMSEWFFLPDGVVDVQDRFKSLLGSRGLGANCSWSSLTYSFNLECYSHEKDIISLLFHNAITSVIREEEARNDIRDMKEKRHTSEDNDSDGDSENDSDSTFSNLSDEVDLGSGEERLINSKRIQSLVIWLSQNDPTYTKRDEHLAAQTTNYGAVSQDVYPPEIVHMAFNAIWRCENGLESILPTVTLERLQQLTGCHLVKILSDKKVYIGAASEENVELAIFKLDNLRKYGAPKIFESHSFYSEETSNIQVSLKLLTNVKLHKKRMYTTTLLDTLHSVFDYSNNYPNLEHAITVRCAPYLSDMGLNVPVTTLNKIALITDGSSNNGDSTVWKNFTYSSKGDESTSPQRRFPNNSQQSSKKAAKKLVPSVTAKVEVNTIDTSTAAGIKEWADSVPKVDPPINAVNTNVFVEGKSVTANGELGASTLRTPDTQNSREKVPAWEVAEPTEGPVYKGKKLALSEKLDVHKPHKLAQNFTSLRNQQDDRNEIKILSSGSISPQKSLLGVGSSVKSWGLSKQADPTPAEAQGNKHTHFERMIAEGKDKQRNLQAPPRNINPEVAERAPGFPRTSTSLDVEESSKVTGSAPSEDLFVAEGSLIGDSSSGANYGCSLLDDDISMLFGNRFEPIVPGPPEMKAVHAQLDNDSRKSNDKIPNQIGPDTVQEHSEVETRKFYNTMNQKAPKPGRVGYKSNPFAGRLPGLSPPRKPPAKRNLDRLVKIDPQPEFCAELTANFEHLVSNIRGFQGKVILQVEFGRILIRGIKRTYIADKDMKDLSLTTDHLQKLLGPPINSKATQPSTSFTNKLTTEPREIEYLLKLRDSSGNQLWKELEFDWSITYEFAYYDREYNVVFSIEINGETFNTTVKIPRNFGSVFVHGTMRAWDFRISASGAAVNEDLESRYSGLAAALKHTLYIPKDLHKPELWFETDKTTQEQFELLELRVHRVKYHESVDKQSSLKISEIQSLDVASRPVSGKDIIVFKATLGDISEEAFKKLRFWYQVSIVCVEASQLIKQNENLELGSEAEWTPQQMTREQVAAKMYYPACEMLKQMDGVGYWNEHGFELKAAELPAPPTNEKLSESKAFFW